MKEIVVDTGKNYCEWLDKLFLEHNKLSYNFTGTVDNFSVYIWKAYQITYEFSKNEYGDSVWLFKIHDEELFMEMLIKNI